MKINPVANRKHSQIFIGKQNMTVWSYYKNNYVKNYYIVDKAIKNVKDDNRINFLKEGEKIWKPYLHHIAPTTRLIKFKKN